MKDIDFLQQYAEAVKDSSNRTRQILLVMIIASILVFAAFWNSRSNGWISSRRTLTVAAVDMLETKRRVASARLELDDIVDAKALCVKLKRATDPVSQYVAEHLSEETRTALNKTPRSRRPRSS